MSDNITPEMIHAERRKASLIDAIRRTLDAKIQHGKSLPDMTPETLDKLTAMRDGYIAKAEALPAEFFAGLADVGAAMAALNK